MPNSKPWLLSSEMDLARDKLKGNEYRSQYNSSHPFPGVESSLEDKIQWVKNIDETYEEIMMDSCFRASAPDPVDFAKEMLLEKCPSTLRVDFVADFEKLKAAAGNMSSECENKFRAKISAFIPEFIKVKKEMPASWDTMESCLSYLEENAKVSDPSGSVIVASKELGKDCTAIDEMNKILQELGLGDHVQGATGSNHETDFWQWGLSDVLGKNLYSKDASGVYWRMYLNFNKDKASMSNVEKATAAYQAELKKKKVESGKVYVLMKTRKKDGDDDGDDSDSDEDEDEDEDEELPVTSENYQPMWLPHVYKEHYDRIAGHFFEGEGEAMGIQLRLKKGNTDTGNLRITIFYRELKYARKLTSVSEKLAAVFALTQVGAYDNYWMHDNENPSDVKRLVKSLASTWKNDLLVRDDEHLSLGLADGSEGQSTEDGIGASRALLYDHLKLLGKEYECEEDIKFDWKPPMKKRKKSDD